MNCFVICSENVNKRLDPPYLRNIVSVNNVKTKYPLFPLDKLLKDSPQYGANEAAVDGNKEKDVRYIRITDIDEFGNLKSEGWKTAKIIEEKYLLKENDILFARSGATAGKTFIYKNIYGKAIFAGYLIRFKFDETKVNPSYVFYYTQLQRYALWVKSIKRPSGQPNINSEEFKAFEIPFPPLEIQSRIVSIMQSVYEKKKQKEQDADNLLNSIDDFVLGELGIKLPALQDKKCFIVNSEDIEGRIDPYYYLPKFLSLIDSLLKSKYNLKKLEEISSLIINGIDYRKFTEQGIPYLRVANIKANKFDLNDIKYIPQFDISKDITLEEGDLLVTRKGSYGIAVIVDSAHKNCVISSEIFRIKLNKEEVVPFYISTWLNTNLAKTIFDRIKTGGIMGHISQDVLRGIQIPLPPLDIQNKIADEVKNRMSQAKKMRIEAAQIIETAKQEVEKIITLG